MIECFVDKNKIMTNLIAKLDAKAVVACFGMLCLSVTTICLGICVCKTKVCIKDKGLYVNSYH
mgnify:CR=1 FL=1